MPDVPPKIELLSAEPHRGFDPPYVDNLGSGHGTHRLRVFTIVFAVVSLLWLTYTFMRPAVYRSSAVLMTESTVAGPEPEALSRRETIARQSEVLKSRSVLEKVLSALAPGNGSHAPSTTVSDLDDMLEVVPVGEAGIVELRAEGTDRETLPLLINAWIDAYLAVQTATRQTSVDSADAALRKQEQVLQDKVLAKRAELEAFRAKHDIVSMERDENRALSRLKGLSEALNKANEQEVAAEARLNAMREAIGSGKPVVRIEDERTLANLEQRAAQLRERLKGYEQRFTPTYMALDPNVKTVQRNLADVEDQIRHHRQQAQEAALTEAEQKLVGAREATAKLREQLNEYKQTVATFTARFSEHAALQEELTELERLYREVQQRMVQTEVLDDDRLPRLTVLERAYVPEHPIRPLYLRDAAVGVAGAFVLALLSVWIYEFLTHGQKEGTVFKAGPFFYRITQRPPQGGELPAAQPTPALTHTPLRELSDPEVQALLEASDASTAALTMALLSGLSAEEAAVLRWADVDLESKHIHVHGRGARSVPLPPRLRDALVVLRPRDTAGTAPVWTDEAGDCLNAAEAAAIIESAAHDAGIHHPTEVTAASLRYTFLAFLARQGARLKDLKGIAGPIPATELVVYGRLAPPGPGVALERIERVHPALRSAA